MSKPEYKLLPCLFCTIGFNSYVAGHKLITTSYQLLKNSNKAESCQSQQESAPSNSLTKNELVK